MQLVTGSVAIPFMELLEIQVMQTKLVLDAVFIFTIVVTIRNWNRGSMAVAWLMLFWSYLPVISFIGWHYAFPGGLFRSIYWAVWIQALAVQILEDFPRLPPWLLGRLIPAPAADDGHFLD